MLAGWLTPELAGSALTPMIFTGLGILCVAYTVAELARAWGSAPVAARFGAVDAETGRPIDVIVDRRTRGRRAGER